MATRPRVNSAGVARVQTRLRSAPQTREEASQLAPASTSRALSRTRSEASASERSAGAREPKPNHENARDLAPDLVFPR